MGLGLVSRPWHVSVCKLEAPAALFEDLTVWGFRAGAIPESVIGAPGGP